MKTYNYNRILDVLEIKIGGKLSNEEFTDHYKKIVEDDTLPSNLKVLIGCRDTRFKVNTEEIEELIESLKKATDKFETIQEAIVVEMHFKPTFETLFEKYNGFDNYSYKIFTTNQMALKWLS